MAKRPCRNQIPKRERHKYRFAPTKIAIVRNKRSEKGEAVKEEDAGTSKMKTSITQEETKKIPGSSKKEATERKWATQETS
ncbi:hypothetical protein Trydic_g6867 [Trypoxylus dichotomus]